MSGDRTSELWLKIDGLHIKYLQAEEAPAKLEIRKKLEGYVTEYLNLVPHDRKFVSITTGDIILQSARWIHGFSLTKAANAFGAIERYAANLINQPWRQEFWSIKQYSGFYKHSVQSSLSGAEKLFYDMGYRETGPDCMELSGTKQGGNPVNVDAATSVARDCLLAGVECNILADIHNGVSLQFQITMEELLEFRKDHIGTAEKAMQELIYRKNQAQYGGAPMPWEGAPPAGYGLNAGFMPPGYPGLPGYMPHQGLGHQFPLQAPGFPPGVNPAIPSHIDQMKAAQAAQFHNGGIPLHNGMSMHNGGFPPQAPAAHAMAANGFRMNGVEGNNHMHVPTGRLVELEQDKTQSPPGSSTSTLRQGQIPTTILELTGENRRGEAREEKRNGRGHHGRGGARARDSGEQIDNWDFVYKKLDADGYNKDQAERPDILNQQGRNRESGRGRNDAGREKGGRAEYETPTTQGRVYTGTEGVETDEEVMKNMTSLRLNGKMDSGRQIGRQVEGRRDTSESEQDASKYDSAVSQDKYSSAVSQEDGRDRNRQYNGQRETPQRAARGAGYTQQQGGVAQNQRKTSKESPEGKFWECSTCTFHNREDKSICEMCGKTMDQPTARKSQIDVQNDDGGLTCDKCTLLNEEGAKICEACGATLGMTYSPIRPARKNSWEPMRRNSRLEFPPLC